MQYSGMLMMKKLYRGALLVTMLLAGMPVLSQTSQEGAALTAVALEQRFGPLGRLVGTFWQSNADDLDRRWMPLIRTSADGTQLIIDEPDGDGSGQLFIITGDAPRSLRFTIRFYFASDQGEDIVSGPLSFSSGRYTTTRFSRGELSPEEQISIQVERGGGLTKRLSLAGVMTVDYRASQMSADQYAAAMPAHATSNSLDKAFADSQRMTEEVAEAERELGLDKSMGEMLVATMAGAAAVAAQGGDAQQILGGAMQGLGSTSPDGVALQRAGEEMMGAAGREEGQARSPAIASTNGRTMAGGGFKPNLAATAACSGFTESNYQQMALRGGGDTQLDVMCGQAFSLYVSYKKSVEQGFPVADVDRAYEAHRQSATVAEGYARSHAAR